MTIHFAWLDEAMCPAGRGYNCILRRIMHVQLNKATLDWAELGWAGPGPYAMDINKYDCSAKIMQ